MPDYYSLLVKKITEADNDPAKLRELVYEAARLALKRHVNVHYPGRKPAGRQAPARRASRSQSSV